MAFYNIFKVNLMTKKIDLGADGDQLKVALYPTGLTHTNTDTAYAVSFGGVTELATATGYTRGGASITKASQSVASGTTVTYDAPDVAWTSADFTANYAVVYDDTVGATNNLIMSIDFGGAKVVSGEGTFTIVWHVNGIITLT